MKKKEFENRIKRPATIFQVGGFRPEDSLTASWIGNITVKKRNESWPESNGQPMIPICQLNLSGLSDIPESLKDVKLLTLFIDSNDFPDDQPNGEGWLIRTYSDLQELEVMEKPSIHFSIKPFQLKASSIDNDFPSFEDCPIKIPEEFEEDYYDLFPNQEGIKIGGWPTLIQSEIYWAPLNKHPAEPEFIFQIDSIAKANLNWGDNGVAYIGRGTKPETKNVWTFSWQCF